MIRAVKLSLKFATPSKLRKVVAVLDRYRSCVNKYIDVLWNDPKAGLDGETWNRIRRQRISTRYQSLALQQAIGICAATREAARVAGNKVMQPSFFGSAILGSTVVDIAIDKLRSSGRHFDIWLRLSTLRSRRRIDIPLKATKVLRKWLAVPGARLKTGCCIGGKPGAYFVTLWVDVPTPLPKTTGDCLGVDVGINKLLATSDGKKYGGEMKTVMARVRRRKSGSKGKRRARIHRDQYANRVVNQLPWSSLQMIAVENLKNLKKGKKPNRNKSFRKFVAPWVYAYVLKRIEQKALENGVLHKAVSPAYTSQICPPCGHRATSNRSNEKFKCTACGYSGDADHVGSLNILNRALGSVESPRHGRSKTVNYT